MACPLARCYTSSVAENANRQGIGNDQEHRDEHSKSFVFGFAISAIATFEGFYAQPTAEGVSRATTRTVVHSALLVLALDLILTGFMLQTWGN